MLGLARAHLPEDGQEWRIRQPAGWFPVGASEAALVADDVPDALKFGQCTHRTI
jgi:hypothetical protein